MKLPSRIELVDIVTKAVKESGAQKAFRMLPPFDVKSDHTPVTAIDKAIQKFVFDALRQDGLYLIGEEDGSETYGDAEYAVAIDPLDGTDAFIRGIPTSACAVTILQKRNGVWFPIRAIIAEIHAGGMVWSAEENGNTFVSAAHFESEIRCQVPNMNTPYRVTVSSWPTAPFNLDKLAAKLPYPQFQDQAFGSIALGGGLIACGGTDATIFPSRSALETVAMTLIVRGAGGVATDFSGVNLAGFTLGVNERSGKPDFLLPHGAIMATHRQIANELCKHICALNA